MKTNTRMNVTMATYRRGLSSKWRSWSALVLIGIIFAFLQAQVSFAASTDGTSDKLTDIGITRALETDLQFDTGVSAHLIDVKTDDGIVTLSGSVDNLLSKDRAVRIAKSIRGVLAVVDEISVKPATRSDKEIQSDIEHALIRNPATDSYQVNVEVKDGVATLTGQADSMQEKELSAQVAKGVRGVKGITNEIDYKWVVNRPDSEVQADIRARLDSDVWVDSGLVAVSVENGDVKLDGSVGSAAEKTRASNDAWVTGVRVVDATRLSVDPLLRDKEKKKSAYIQKTDDEIKKAVKNAFLYDPRVYSFNPDVQVVDGMITLMGTVENLQARTAAQEDAENTVGVFSVVNLLKVRPLNPPSDANIAQDIRDALAASPFVDRFDVNVSVLNQKAYLTGIADSAFEKNEAGKLASNVKGVVDVQNNLSVLDYTYTPYTYPYWNYYSYYNQPLEIGPVNGSTLADWRIRESIKSQLFWSPYVDSDQVKVTVEDGVATLKGTVDSRMEQGAAIDNAYQGGAVLVHDQLKVVGEPTS